jgi:hypothetical protein
MRKKQFTRALLAVSSLLANRAICSQISSTGRQLLNTSEVSWNEENLGELLGRIWKAIILICFVLQIVDVVKRKGGSRLGRSGMFHTTRFIWFVYGSSVVWRIGQHVADGYRGFNGKIFGTLTQEIYESYFGIGFVGFFSNTIEISGVS